MRTCRLLGLAISALLLLHTVNAQDEEDKYEILKKDWCGDFNCYEVLEVTQDVEFKEIKRRYNNLSLELHPDKNPNQTEADKERYVIINRAYEILSSKRREYDEYLRIKSSLDSPVESPFVVLVLLYLGIAYVVLYYQRQKQEQCKDAILKQPQVIRYYWEEKNIDLTGKKKVKGKKGKKKGKGNSDKSLKELKKGIGHEELNDVIQKLNLVVPEYSETQPTYQQACVQVFTSVLSMANELLFQLKWVLKYKLLKQDYSDEDREYLCRKHHGKSEIEWNTMPEDDRQRLLKKNGIWNKRKKDDDDEQSSRRKKRN
mmetsp:Transcript_19716/g.31374  ORF Transcript_19716/g.31374 Transcript_19716/m.31374 type:complete len:315 (-) Transcript_19716:106-1050(-)